MKMITLNARRSAAALLVAALGWLTVPLTATPPFGFTSTTFRGAIAGDVNANQWDPSPLFSLQIQSSADQWGFDVVQGTTEFAAADASGKPSQSGWHDHPTALSIGLVVQGTVWSQEGSNPSCLQAIPTGSVFFERSGHIHNNYNLDPKTSAVVRIIHFVDRNQSATRRDQPDPLNNSTTTATAPPPVCQTPPSAADHSPGDLSSATGTAASASDRTPSFPPPVAIRRRLRPDGTLAPEQ